MRFPSIIIGRRTTALIIVALTVSTLPLLAVIWFFFGSAIDTWLHQRTFNAVLWKADVWDKEKKRFLYGGNWPPRLCMVDDLLASRRLKGMTKSQVIELLGAPENESTALTYYLGPERGFIRIDSETFVIEFDDQGKVKRQRISRD